MGADMELLPDCESCQAMLLPTSIVLVYLCSKTE